MRLARALAVVLVLCNRDLDHVGSFHQPVLSAVPSTTKPTPSLLTKEEIRKIQVQREEQMLQKHDNVAWNALFVSCPERAEPVPITETQGAIPAGFPPGSLLRLGPNGADSSEGFFDGDGMVQCITFPPNKAQSTFSATYIETKGRALEKASGGIKKFKGTLSGVPRAFPMIQSIFENALTFQTLQAQKDTCNTALAEHGGRVLALMEQCPPTNSTEWQDQDSRGMHVVEWND